MGHVNLKNDERVDQLYSNNIKIIQSSEVFSFSLDAVMLANFANIKKAVMPKLLISALETEPLGCLLVIKQMGKYLKLKYSHV